MRSAEQSAVATSSDPAPSTPAAGRLRRAQRLVVGQDRPAASSWSSGPGSRPELGDERLPRVRIGVEGLRLASGAIQGEHELRTQALAQRIGADERSTARRRARAWRPQARSASILASRAASRSSSSALVARQAAKGSFARSASGWATPERECLAQSRRRRDRRVAVVESRARPRFDECAEALRDRAARAAIVERVARRAGDEHGVRLERLPQPRDVLLQRSLCIRRRTLAPELVDEAVAGDGLARRGAEGARAPLRCRVPPSASCRSPSCHLERAENAEIERARQMRERTTKPLSAR